MSGRYCVPSCLDALVLTVSFHIVSFYHPSVHNFQSCCRRACSQDVTFMTRDDSCQKICFPVRGYVKSRSTIASRQNSVMIPESCGMRASSHFCNARHCRVIHVILRTYSLHESPLAVSEYRPPAIADVCHENSLTQPSTQHGCR